MRWHKASRGAPGAVARNRVPEVLALPANPPNTPWPSRFQASAPQVLPPPDPTDNRAADIFLHLVSYGEGNHFQAPHVQYWTALRSHLPEPSTLHRRYGNVPPLTLTGANDGLLVQFDWSSAWEGAPPRDYRHLGTTDTYMSMSRWPRANGCRCGTTGATITMRLDGITRSMCSTLASLTRSFLRCLLLALLTTK